MNKQILLLIFLIINFNLSAQDTDWFEYELDTIITVDMPGEEVFVIDTIFQNVRLYQLYTTVGTSTYISQRSEIEKKLEDNNLSGLPHDKASLDKYYQEFAEGMRRGTSSEGVDGYEIEKDGLIGRRVIISDSSGKQFYESELYLINNYMYTISYINKDSTETEDKNFYLNSLKINQDSEISQFSGKSRSYRLGYVMGKWFFYLVFAVGAIALIVVLTKKKKKHIDIS